MREVDRRAPGRDGRAHAADHAVHVLRSRCMNALLLVGTAAIGIALWAHGAISAGVVATALPLAWQIANVAGWVSWEVTGIFENIGVVQEGMQTIAVPHTRRRPARRAASSRSRAARSASSDVTFGYGRSDARAGARRPQPRRSGPASASASSAARAPASRRSSTCCCASTSSKQGRILIDGQDIARRDAGEPARGDRHGDAGHVAAASLDRGQHPLRPARARPTSRSWPRREQGAGARVHPRPARLERPHRLRRARRRARRQALRRPAPAHRASRA